MSWIGAGIGALLGSRGGLLSSLVGAVVGNWVEEKVRGGGKAAAAEKKSAETSREQVVLAAIAAMLSKVAKSDGVITLDEVRFCERVFNRLGLEGEKREYCIRVFRQAKDDGHSIMDYAKSFADAEPSENVRNIVYDILWDLACVDGTVADGEREMLRTVAAHMRVNEQLYYWQCRRRGLLNPSSSEKPTDPYTILGCRRTDPDEVVRKAYHDKAKSLHPDVLRAQGVSEELLEKASDQMARVNAAWAEIRKFRNL